MSLKMSSNVICRKCHFLIKRDKEINPHTTKKNSNEKKEHSIRKKDKVDSVEDEFNSFCGRAKDVAEEFDISNILIFKQSIAIDCNSDCDLPTDCNPKNFRSRSFF